MERPQNFVVSRYELLSMLKNALHNNDYLIILIMISL